MKYHDEIGTVIFRHLLRSCDTITIFSVDISAAQSINLWKDSGRICFESKERRKDKIIASNIFPRDAASITYVFSRRISSAVQYFYSQANVRVRFILKGGSNLLNLFRANDLFLHVYAYTSTLLTAYLRRFKETSTTHPDRSREKKDKVTLSQRKKSAALS